MEQSLVSVSRKNPSLQREHYEAELGLHLKQFEPVQRVHIPESNEYPRGQLVQLLPLLQEVSILQVVPVSEYPSKQVKHPASALHVAQGKGQA